MLLIRTQGGREGCEKGAQCLYIDVGLNSQQQVSIVAPAWLAFALAFHAKLLLRDETEGDRHRNK
jgi:hypothetical protein